MWQLKSLRAEQAHGGATREVARRPGAPTTLSVGGQRPAGGSKHRQHGGWLVSSGLVSLSGGAGPSAVADPACFPASVGPPPVRWSSGTQPQATATAPHQPVHSARFPPARRSNQDQPTNGRARMEGPRPRHRPGKKREPRRPVRSRSVAPARQRQPHQRPSSMGAYAFPSPRGPPRRARVRFHVPPRGGSAICPPAWPRRVWPFRAFRVRSNVRALRPPRTRTLSRVPPAVRVLARSRGGSPFATCARRRSCSAGLDRQRQARRQAALGSPPARTPPHACVWFCVRGPARFGSFRDVRKRGRRQQL